METLQVIWRSLTTPNEGLSAIIFNDFGIPFIFIEMTLDMLLFTVILNINSTKKQRILFVVLSSIASCISNVILNKPYSIYLNMLICPILVFFIFRTTLLKSIIAEIIPMIIASPIEILIAKLYSIFFDMQYETAFLIPLTRISITSLIYLTMFFIYIFINKYKHSFIFSNTISKNNKIVIFINTIVGILTIGTQFYLIGFYNDYLPFRIILLSLLTLTAYFFISLFSLFKITQLEITSQNLEQAKDYNNTLKVLYDDIRTFRHDFGNIVQAIGGYIETEDLNGLKKYYKQLQSDCEDIKSLEILNPTTINNPAVYSLITSKYHKATKLGIKTQISISLKLENLNMKIYEFTRILGILLDNAIEACENCEEKIINFEIRRDIKSPRQLLLIQNTYGKDIDLNEINKKGYTSKEDKNNSHGLGLWEVQKIIKHYKNLNLYTTKDSIFFTQQLEIYDK